jgi:predicted MFS family arabinose efflux permease
MHQGLGNIVMAVSDAQGSAVYRALRMIVLLGGAVLAGMVQLAILPAMPEMGAHFAGGGHDGTFIAQNVTTISALAMAFGGPLVGWAAGLIGKRRVLLVSALIYGLAGGVGAYAPDLWTLLASRVLLGIASAGYVTIGVSFIGDYYPDPAQRDRLIGWFTVVGGIGSLAVLMAAGLLTKTGGWHAPFALYLSGLPLFLIGLFTITDVPVATADAAAGSSGSVLGAWGLYALIILISISMYTVTIQGVFLMNEEGISDPTITSNVMLLTSIGTIVGAYVFRFVRPALGFGLTLALIWGLLAVGNAGFASSLNVYVLSICAGLVGTGSGFMTPLMTTAVLGAVPASASARAVGLAMGCLFLGQFLHPLALAPLRTAFGLHDAFFWMGGASLAAAALAIVWSFRGSRRAVA